MSSVFKREGNKLIPVSRDCRECFGKGTIWAEAYKPCPKCRGTGLKGRGKCRECNGYQRPNQPNGTVADYTKQKTCPHCNGKPEAFDIPDMTDYLQDEIWQGLTFKVYRDERPLSWNESHLGFGCVYSCMDYGTAYKSSDEEIIEVVRKHTGHQACKVVRDDGTLADHVGIFIATGGYSVRAVFDSPEIQKTIIRHERLHVTDTRDIYK